MNDRVSMNRRMSTNGKMTIGSAVVGLFLCASFHSRNLSADTAPERITIGVSVPLSGDSAVHGTDIQSFLRFANETLAENRYDFRFEDDKCSPKDAVAAANKLVHVEKVRYVLGFACSGAILAAAPIFEQARIPVIVTFASSPRIRDAGEYIFRTFPSDAVAGQKLYAYARKKHRTMAILSEQTDYAQDLKSAFAGSNSGGDLEVIVEDYLPGTSDFRTSLLRLKSKNPEALFIITQGERAFATILDQLEVLRWRPQIYGAYWPGSLSLQRLAGAKLNGTVFVDAPPLDGILNEGGKALLKKYQDGGGGMHTTETLFATTVEAFRALDAAIRSNTSPEKFLSHEEFNGVFGRYRFDERGEISGLSLVLKRIEQGRPVPIEE
jgi:branched-chain amino acid transport system substrate-binding protein